MADDKGHFITRADMRRWFLLKLRDILPHARSDEDRWAFARYALHVEDIKEWPGDLGRRVGVDPATQAGMEKAVEHVRLAAYIAEEAGDSDVATKKVNEAVDVEDDGLFPGRVIEDGDAAGLVLSSHSEAPAVTFTNIEVNGIPVSFTMRQDVTGAESVRVHYEEFQKLISWDWIATLDVCDKNGKVIRRVKGEPEPVVAPPQPAASSPAPQPGAGAPSAPARGGQSGGFGDANKKEHIATSATVERVGRNNEYRALVFRDAAGNKVANLFFPDPAKPRSRLWDMVIDITDAEWPQAQDGASKAISMKLFTIPDPKNPQYNKIIAVGRA